MKEYGIEMATGSSSDVVEGGVMLIVGGSFSCIAEVISNHLFFLPRRYSCFDPSFDASSLSSSDLFIVGGRAARLEGPLGSQARFECFRGEVGLLHGCEERRGDVILEVIENLLLVIPDSGVGVWLGDRDEVYGSSKDTRDMTFVSILGIFRRVEGVVG